MTRPAPTTVEELLGHPKFGAGVGFRRLSLLLRPLLQSPWGSAFTTIKVTGSNGKGSVTALVHAILRGLGVDCGRHTSPHLVKFHERIVVRDADLTDDQLEQAFGWLGPASADVLREVPGERFGSFELITALCVRAFRDAGVAAGVMEVGIGGRYDPLRLLPGRLVALTSVDLEHTELLGKTEELIAYEKLDLCPDGGTVVAIRRDDDVWGRMAAYCRLRGITLIDANEVWSVTHTPDAPGRPLDRMQVALTSRRHDLRAAVPLVGTFQLDNISIACTVAEVWAGRFLPGLPGERFAEGLIRGLSATRWPGRFEQISAAPPVVVDVGHTPGACDRVAESVRTFLPGGRVLLVTGASSDKAVEDILRALVPVADGVVCTRAYHKGESVRRVAGVVRRLAPSVEVWEAETIEQAAVFARQIATSRAMTVLVAGGLFLAVEFRTAWEGLDPRSLRFY